MTTSLIIVVPNAFALVSGAVRLEVDGQTAPVDLSADDCVLLPHGRDFTMSSGPGIVAKPLSSLPDDDWNGGIATVNGGGDMMMLGGHFDFTAAHTDLLVGSLQAIAPFREGDARVGLMWTLDRKRRELVDAGPGASLVVGHLAHLVLVQALRLYLSRERDRGVGSFFAITDAQIGPAIAAMHRERSGPCRNSRRSPECPGRDLRSASGRSAALRRSST